MSVDVETPDDWRRHGNAVVDALDRWGKRAAKEALERVGAEYQRLATETLSQPGRGRVYRRRSVVHQASAPGDPPAVDRGLLRASVFWRTGEGDQGPWVEVGSPEKVAVWMEFGTRTIAPRPWHEPAMRRLAENMPRIMTDAFGSPP